MATFRFTSPEGTQETKEFTSELDAFTYASEYSDSAAITTIEKQVDGKFHFWDRENERWYQSGDVFSLLCWQPKISEFASIKAESVEKAIDIFRAELPHLNLTGRGSGRTGSVGWTVCRNPNPWL